MLFLSWVVGAGASLSVGPPHLWAELQGNGGQISSGIYLVLYSSVCFSIAFRNKLLTRLVGSHFRKACLIQAACGLCICRSGTLRAPLHISFSLSSERIFTLPQNAGERAEVWDMARLPCGSVETSLGVCGEHPSANLGEFKSLTVPHLLGYVSYFPEFNFSLGAI